MGAVLGIPSDTQWSGVTISRAWTCSSSYLEEDFEAHGSKDDPKYLRGFQLTPEWSSVLLPDWFLVFLTAALVAVPWIQWSKQLSLRTLLIAITLVAVGFELILAAGR